MANDRRAGRRNLTRWARQGHGVSSDREGGSGPAAAVLGTEVAVADALAAEVGLRFLELFVGGSSAREALLAARLALLRRLNPLGLGYTLYGTSDLRFVSRP